MWLSELISSIEKINTNAESNVILVNSQLWADLEAKWREEYDTLSYI